MDYKALIKLLRDKDKQLSDGNTFECMQYVVGKSEVSLKIAEGEGETLFEQLEKNPEAFMQMDNVFFKDLSFVADAIEVAVLAQKKVSKEFVKKTVKMLVEDKKKSGNPDNYAPINKVEIERSQNDSFLCRVQLKLGKVYETFKEEKGDYESSPEFKKEMSEFYDKIAFFNNSVSAVNEEKTKK